MLKVRNFFFLKGPGAEASYGPLGVSSVDPLVQLFTLNWKCPLWGMLTDALEISEFFSTQEVHKTHKTQESSERYRIPKVLTQSYMTSRSYLGEATPL